MNRAPRARSLAPILALLLGGLLACRGETQAPEPEVEVKAAPPPPLTLVRLPVLTLEKPFRWDTELRGLATTELELGLADLPGVVALVACVFAAMLALAAWQWPRRVP